MTVRAFRSLRVDLIGPMHTLRGIQRIERNSVPG